MASGWRIARTVAVRVMDWPTAEGLAELERAVVVANVAGAIRDSRASSDSSASRAIRAGVVPEADHGRAPDRNERIRESVHLFECPMMEPSAVDENPLRSG